MSVYPAAAYLEIDLHFLFTFKTHFMHITIQRFEHCYVTAHRERMGSGFIFTEHPSHEDLEDYIAVLLRLAKRQPIEDVLFSTATEQLPDGEIVAFKSFDPSNDTYIDEEEKARLTSRKKASL